MKGLGWHRHGIVGHFPFHRTAVLLRVRCRVPPNVGQLRVVQHLVLNIADGSALVYFQHCEIESCKHVLMRMKVEPGCDRARGRS
eukprot:1940718-Rhodomonas_salina.1